MCTCMFASGRLCLTPQTKWLLHVRGVTSDRHHIRNTASEDGCHSPPLYLPTVSKLFKPAETLFREALNHNLPCRNLEIKLPAGFCLFL